MPDPKKYVKVKTPVKKVTNETATKKDSLDTYSSSQERNEFYRKSGYTEDKPRKFDKSKLNQNDIDEAAFKSVDYKKDKPTTNITKGGKEAFGSLDPKEYAKKIDKHKYEQYDNITNDVNMDSPMGRKDSRIQPVETITFRKGTDIASVEQYQKPADKKKVMVKVKRKPAPVKPAPIKVVVKRNTEPKEESEILKKGSYLSNS